MTHLRLDILPPAQRALWDELHSIPQSFVLYGGTALALQIGHRESIDFDFFSRRSFDPSVLLNEISCLRGATIIAMEANTLTVLCERGAPVQLSFFGVPRLPVWRPALTFDQSPVLIADPLEIGGMKALVVQKRAEAKDYLDIHALITHMKYDLAQLLAAAQFLYGHAYVPEFTLKALSYFGDGNLASVSPAIRRDLAAAVRACDPLQLKAP
jgi:Nucleotidyl transferase AbiEii toxin, Type IV TA system